MSEATDQMAPDASPGQVSKKAGVRRVNNMPMYILGGVMGAFLLVMMLVAADRAAQQNAPYEREPERAGNSSQFAREIAGDLDGGIIEAATPPAVPDLEAADPAPAADPILIARPENLDAPPQPPRSDLGQPATDPDAERIRMAKLQMLEEAAQARTGVQVVAPRSSGSSIGGQPQNRNDMLAQIAAVRERINQTQRDDPTEAYQARLAQLRAAGIGGQPAGGMGSGGAPQLLPTSNSSGGNNYSQFAGSGEGDRWQLNAQPEAPRSPYELRAGFVVPATLISGINSDLPGQIMAQVSQNVYDTATGRHVLIPQGSRLVGSYSSDVAYGQQRVLVAWQRIVFPDGKAMDIGSMPGADGAGYAGFNDRVNNHYWRVFSSAFLMSGVVAGISLSQDNGSTGDRQRASDAMSEALGQVLGQTVAQMVSRNLNIAPTLEIRPGYRFNVIVTKDMTFSKPYQPFDY